MSESVRGTLRSRRDVGETGDGVSKFCRGTPYRGSDSRAGPVATGAIVSPVVVEIFSEVLAGEMKPVWFSADRPRVAVGVL